MYIMMYTVSYKAPLMVFMRNTNSDMSTNTCLKHLMKKKTNLQCVLSKNVGDALFHCNKDKPMTHNDNNYCHVIWKEIEEISWKLDDIKTEIDEMS
jgi:hypothetical protein